MKATNVATPFQGDDSARKIDESRQYLSPCSPEIGNSILWVGHAAK